LIVRRLAALVARAACRKQTGMQSG